jgi:hypothetical protein
MAKRDPKVRREGGKEEVREGGRGDCRGRKGEKF